MMHFTSAGSTSTSNVRREDSNKEVGNKVVVKLRSEVLGAGVGLLSEGWQDLK
jgi:hypothetical protein